MALEETSFRSAFHRLLRDEGGQDLIEYALLAAFIGVVGILAWTNIQTGIGRAYTGWDSGVKTLSSCTPDPGGAGCPPS
jgi:pilus assembly protein Flp/PilA